MCLLYFEKIEKKEDMLLLPEEITGDLLGVVNAIEHHIGIISFVPGGSRNREDGSC